MASKKGPSIARTAEQPAPETALDYSRSLQKLTPENFFRFIAGYPNPDGLSVYVYRVAPVIDRALAGVKNTNIDAIASGVAGIDEEYLLRQHGSGKYHLKLSDANKPRGLTEVAKTTIEVYDPLCAPRLNPVELVVGAAGNDRYIQGYLEKGWTVQENKLVAPAPADTGQAAMAKTISELAARPAADSSVVARLVDAITSRPPSGDGDFERALKLAERLTPKADAVQVELIRALSNIATKGHGGQAAEVVNPLQQIRETAGLLKEFGYGAQQQAAAPAAGPSWIEAIIAAAAAAPALLELVKQMAAMRAAGPVVPIRAELEQPAQVAAAAAVETGEQSMFGKLGFNLVEFEALGKDALAAFLRGTSGRDFAIGLCQTRANGEDLYNAVCDLGRETVMMALNARCPAAIRDQLKAKEAELSAWLDSFIAASEVQAAEDPAAASVDPAA